MKKDEQKRWNEAVNAHWWVRGHQLIAKELIRTFLPACEKDRLKILDVGCSGGSVTEFLQQFGKVYGFDISFDGLTHCAHKDLVLMQSDAVAIPFKDKIFDAITILEVAEHVKNDTMLLREAFRVCKKNGLVFIMVPAYQFLWGSHDIKYSHVRRYTKQDIIKLTSSRGFKTERLTYMHPHLLLPLMFLRFIDKFRKKSIGKHDDFLSLGHVIDNVLFNTLMLELTAIKHINFPFGTCLFSVLRKE